MSTAGLACPHCGSTDTKFRAKAGQWDCQSCEKRFVEEERICVTLADSPDWIAEVLTDWPGPVAHEYDRLRKLSRKEHGDETGFNQLVKDLTSWRNQSFGHGAFRADQAEFLKDLNDHLPPIHRELGIHRDAWRGLILQRGDGTGLTGATSI